MYKMIFSIKLEGEGKLMYLVSTTWELVETNCQISFIRWECTKLGEGDTQ